MLNADAGRYVGSKLLLIQQKILYCCWLRW